MIIDCESCAMLNTDTCHDCVVTVLLGGGPVAVDEAEKEALEALANAGLVPHLRLVDRGPHDDRWRSASGE
jgi:hypothetical protein